MSAQLQVWYLWWIDELVKDSADCATITQPQLAFGLDDWSVTIN